jgi:hypothetical protein
MLLQPIRENQGNYVGKILIMRKYFLDKNKNISIFELYCML